MRALQQSKSSRLESAVPVLLGCVSIGALLALRLAMAPGSPSLAVIFPPWLSTPEMIARATEGARLVSLGTFPGVVIVTAAKAGYHPGQALLVVPSRVLAGCGRVEAGA